MNEILIKNLFKIFDRVNPSMIEICAKNTILVHKSELNHIRTDKDLNGCIPYNIGLYIQGGKVVRLTECDLMDLSLDHFFPVYSPSEGRVLIQVYPF